jgi:hypothetical protein
MSMTIHLGSEGAARRQQWADRDHDREADGGAPAAAEDANARASALTASPAALSRLLPPSPRDPNAQREVSAERVWRGRGPRRLIDDSALPRPAPRTALPAAPTPPPSIAPASRPATQSNDTTVQGASGPHDPFQAVMVGGATRDGGGAVTRATPLPTAPRMEVASLNLMLADPLVREMISAHAPTVRDLGNGAVARALVARYGVNLAQRLDQYSRATAGVRAAYVQAVEAACQPAGGLYAVSQMQPPVQPVDGQLHFDPFTWVASGGLNPFDPAAFTADYSRGASVSQRAFAMLYGAGAERLELTVGNIIETTTTDPQSHEVVGRGVSWRPTALSSGPETGSLDAVAPPRLYQTDAVGFDPAFGWVTPSENIYVHQDGLSRLADQVFPVFFGAVITWATVGTGSSIAASVTQSTGSTLAGAAAGAASMAAVSSAATQFAATGTINFRQLLRTTLSGAITGGVLNELGVSAQQLQGLPFANRMIGLTGAATVQGALQQVLGGRFKDGFTNAMAGGLANEIGQALQAQFAQLQGQSPAQQSAFRLLTQATTSAVRALGSPGDANHTFAQVFLSELVGNGLNALAPAPTAAVPAPAAPIVGPALDDEGNLMPGVVDSATPWAEQLQAVRERLITQGVDADTAQQVVAGYAQRVQDDAFDAFISAQPRPVLLAGPGSAADVRSAREVIDTIEQRIAQGSLQGPQIGHAIEDAYSAYLRLASTAAAADTPPTVDQERAAARLISLIGDLGQAAQQDRSTLSAEQQALVRQSRALQAQNNLPEIYGAAAGGGILALRQSQRLQALQAWAAQPGLRHPNQLIGRTDGGPGQWVYAPRRSSGQDYQEQVSGVPRGIEYEVRGVKLDSYDAARRVAVDAKDWQGYPPPGTDFWQKGVVKLASDQLDALRGTGVKLEWQVSTPQAAQQVRDAFNKAGDDNPALREISVVVVPRRTGP